MAQTQVGELGAAGQFAGQVKVAQAGTGIQGPAFARGKVENPQDDIFTRYTKSFVLDMQRKLTDLYERLQALYNLTRRGESIYEILATMHREPLLAAEKQADPKTVTPYGFTAFSQTDEDGILEEIYRRIGTTNRQFFEFGCGNGLENNSTYLLFTGWQGVWMDGSAENIATVRQKFDSYLNSGKLKVLETFVTRDNINSLIEQSGLHKEMDLAGIDIDGNDYWIWEAITGVRPRVVVIEYNAIFRPPHKIVQEYNPGHQWRGTNYFGASLKALEALGERKGYRLVGCSFSGVNAFFVRQDLTGDLFSAPFTAEHHYRAPRYDAFVRGLSRHPKDAGPYRVLE
jgi:hypothetical protein